MKIRITRGIWESALTLATLIATMAAAWWAVARF
jgi:hypothetical protein